MNRNKLIKSQSVLVIFSIITNILAMALNYAISFVLTPYITNKLGIEAYGYVTLVKTVANYGIIITSCLNAYASRYIIVSYHKNDLQKTNKYYSSILIANIVLFVLFLFFAGLLAYNMEVFFDVPNEILHDVKILLFLNIVNFISMTLGGVFTVVAYVKNQTFILGIIKMSIYSVEASILILLFSFNKPKVYFVGIALFISTIVGGILQFLMKQKLLPELHCSMHMFSIKAVKNLLGRGLWSALNQLGNILNTGLDLWITNLMLSSTKLGELSIIKTVYSIFAVFPALIVQPFQPKLYEYYAKGKKEKVVLLLKTEIKLMGLISGLFVTGFVTCGKAYFDLWTPNQNSELLNILAIVTLVGFCFEAMAFPLFDTYMLSLKNSIPCVVTACSGGLNFIGMYLLLRFTNLELYAVVGTTTVLGFLVYFLFTPIYSSKCLNLSFVTFFPMQIKTIFSILGLSLVIKRIFKDIVISSWIKLIIIAIVITLIYTPVYLIIHLNKDEKQQVLKKLKQL